MDNNRSFDDLMSRLEAGNDTAATHLFQLYGERLIALARSRMDVRIRRKLDPEDVVQSVFKSFFKRQAAGKYDLGDWDCLWALLVRITINKCINRNHHFRTRRRNVDAEVSQVGCNNVGAPWNFISRLPGPEEAAVFMETMHEAMRRLSGTDCKIIEMWAQGCSHREISSDLKVPQATVQRVTARVRRRLQRMLSEQSSQ